MSDEIASTRPRASPATAGRKSSSPATFGRRAKGERPRRVVAISWVSRNGYPSITEGFCTRNDTRLGNGLSKPISPWRVRHQPRLGPRGAEPGSQPMASVTLNRHRGAQIRSLTRKEALDVLNLLEILVGFAARSAAAQIPTPDDRKAFEI